MRSVGHNLDSWAFSAYHFELAPELDLTPGDTNGDAKIDFADFLSLSANFGKVDAVWADGDFDGDGTADFADFVLLSQNFGQKRN